MCGFYDDEQKIKKGDKAIYQGTNVTIQSAKHIKENRTMDIIYIDDSNNENMINIPYQTSGFDIQLQSRD